MSTPSPITDHTIENYCAIRDDILSTITYCTTTAIQGPKWKISWKYQYGWNS